MKHSELKELADSEVPTKKYRKLIKNRMYRFWVYSELDPPERISSSGVKVKKLKGKLLSTKSGSQVYSGVLNGVGVSPGEYKGTVRILTSPEELYKFKPGEILVCPTTNPAWTPIFPLAGALITDVGGMLSHGAVVAREYRLPAVLGVVVATTTLATGDVVEVDGGSGTVTVIKTKVAKQKNKKRMASYT